MTAKSKTYGFNGDYICFQRAVFRMRYCFCGDEFADETARRNR